MYKILQNLQSQLILEKYELYHIDVTYIIMYRKSLGEIFKDIFFEDVVFLLLKNINGEEISLKVVVQRGKIKIIFEDEKFSDLVDFFSQQFLDYEASLGDETLKKLFVIPLERDILLYYFFSDYLDFDSFFFLTQDNSILSEENIEPEVFPVEGDILYNSDRSIVKRHGESVIKRFRWINSLFGVSKKDFIINSIFLRYFGYIESVVYSGNYLEVTMPFYQQGISCGLMDVVECLIRLNKSTYIGKHRSLNIGFVHDDPNIGNFIKDVSGNVYPVDFDSASMSFVFLQPLYLFIDVILTKTTDYDEMIKVFKLLLIKFFQEDFYQEDFRILGVKNIFCIYRNIYVIGIEKNNDWVDLDEKGFEYKKKFFDAQKDLILPFLMKLIN